MDRGAVISRFTVTSLFMWTSPLFVLLAFNQQWFIDLVGVAKEHSTLVSGLVAVLSVNVVMAVYIYMAMKDKPTSATPQPDPAFLAAAQRALEPTVGDVQRAQAQAQVSGAPSELTARRPRPKDE